MTESLISVSHYHHQGDRQPAGNEIPAGTEYIEVVTQGRAWITENDQWLEVTPGAILWHKPGDRAIQLAAPDHPYSCLVIRFQTTQHAQYSVPRISYWNDLEAINALARQSIRLFTNEQFDSQLLLRYLCEKLYFHACLSQWSQSLNEVPQALQQALQFMDQQALEKISLQQIAAASGWSVSHLHSMFRQHLQQSPHQYLINKRIQEAKIRLVSTQHPIKQIAAECQFSSNAAFATAFKQHTGISPAAYRKTHLN